MVRTSRAFNYSGCAILGVYPDPVSPPVPRAQRSGVIAHGLTGLAHQYIEQRMPRTKTTWPKGGNAPPPKRGPTGKHAQKNPATFLLPVAYEMQPYIERFLCGESLRTLAKEIGISHEGVRRRMIKWSLTGKADKTYAELVTEMLVDRIAEADIQLENALSMIDITRADKVCRYARMDYERRRPHLYGQRAEITVAGPAAIYLGLDVLPQLTQAVGQAGPQADPIIANPLMILEHEPAPEDAS